MRKLAENAAMRSGQRATNCEGVPKGQNRAYIFAHRETIDDNQMTQISLAIGLKRIITQRRKI